MKKFLLISLTIGWLFPCQAQDQRSIDSLETLLQKRYSEKKELRNNKAGINDTTIVNLLFELWKRHRPSNPDKAADYALQGISISEQIGYKKGAAEAYNSLGVIYYMKRDFTTAIDKYKIALKIRKEIKDKKGTAASYNNIGNVQFAQGNYPLALENYITSLKIKEEIKDKQGIADANVNLGNVYNVQGDFKEALKYYLVCLKMNKELGDKEGLENIYINLGTLYTAMRNASEAANAYFSCLKIAEELGDKNIMSDCYNNLGTVYYFTGDMKAEMESYQAALKIKEELGDKTGIATAYINIGGIYTRQKKFREAFVMMNKALTIAKEIESLTTVYECYHALIEVDSALGNFKQAYEHQKLYMLTRDSLVNDEKTKKIMSLQMQYDFDKKEAAIKAAQNIKDAVAKEEIEKQKIVILSVILGSGLVLMIMLLFINRRKSKHALEVNKLENKTLRSQLNPHFIFNALASIQKYMNEHPELAENYLAKFGKLMREVLENSEKDYISLEEEFSMLRKYMDLEKLRVTNGFDYEFIFDANTDEESIQIPPLLLQPVVENAIWHGVANGSSKGKITIRVSSNNEFLTVEIENNSDMKSSKNKEEITHKKKSFGLQIVKDRLALLFKDKRKKGSILMLPGDEGMTVNIVIPY